MKIYGIEMEEIYEKKKVRIFCRRNETNAITNIK
ncbi:hypothetical protein C820_000255 [Clostridium sp. MD294]|nr:hypothetical protein C820_000255 [Clostridium sp. MD294]